MVETAYHYPPFSIVSHPMVASFQKKKKKKKKKEKN